jgi:hypothetical protein
MQKHNNNYILILCIQSIVRTHYLVLDEIIKLEQPITKPIYLNAN